jgi:integrase/recombinase XerD
MPYQYVREPLTAEEADRLANACETPTEQLIVWTLLDTGLRVSELCALTTKDILWQQRQLRFRGKGGPYGKKSKVRVVPCRSSAAAIPFRSRDRRGLPHGCLRSYGIARSCRRAG